MGLTRLYHELNALRQQVHELSKQLQSVSVVQASGPQADATLCSAEMHEELLAVAAVPNEQMSDLS